jgi:hypothetical protein
MDGSADMPIELVEHSIVTATERLRASEASPWPRVRSLLRDRGLALESTVMAEWLSDDHDLFFGIIVTELGQVIQFSYSHLGEPLDNGDLSEWDDITDSWEETPHTRTLQCALAIAGVAEAD